VIVYSVVCYQVDWKLFKDMKPPKSEEEWIEEFEKYKTLSTSSE